MKVKEAVKLLEGKLLTLETIKRLYLAELNQRLSLRFPKAANKVTTTAFESLMLEMDIWITKVCMGHGWSKEDSTKTQQKCRNRTEAFMWQAVNKTKEMEKKDEVSGETPI